MIEFFEVHRRIDRTIVDFQVVLEWFQEQFIVEMIRICENQL